MFEFLSQRIDLVLHEVVSQVIQHWLCLEEKTFLHDAAVVSEEELRTLIDLFRRDASTQKKVGKSVKASLHRVLLLADSVKATNRWCAQMLDFS
ncbi:unnamed protein product [Dicrocoelium dendriticum]|nr:unnamed protein product [Dicrocoelium dendriticum]